MRCNIELCVWLIGEKRKYRVKRHGCIGIDGLDWNVVWYSGSTQYICLYSYVASWNDVDYVGGLILSFWFFLLCVGRIQYDFVCLCFFVLGNCYCP